MAKRPRIYTRTGDDGSTGLASGRRLSKASLRVEAYGTVDELNSLLGLAVAEGCVEEVARSLGRVQGELFQLGAELSLPHDDESRRTSTAIEESHIRALEQEIDAFTSELEPLSNFILPGGYRTAATLHVARTVCRRAERLTVRLATTEELREGVIRYLNRLSDLLFTAARLENHRRGVADVVWDGERS